MTILLPAFAALGGALLSVPIRSRPRLVIPLSLATLALTVGLAAGLDPALEEPVADLTVRMSGLVRLLDLVLLTLLVLITLYVSLAEPVFNHYPVALFSAGALHTVLVLTSALPLFLVLVAALAAPVIALVFRIRENRSLEASMRYFASLAIGGSIGVAALALAAQQPSSLGEEQLPLTLLLVLVIAAFALLLGTLPFHVHLAALTGEAPVAALAVLFGVLIPLTFVAFPLLIALSGVLPAVASVAKAQTVLSTLGLVSSLGGALLAVGAPDLRRLVAYSVTSNVGTCLVGLATFSSSGVIGAVGTMLVTGIAATQQLLASGALSRAMLPEDHAPSARRAPLAAATFLAGSLAFVGLPPLAGFPARFLVEQIAFAVSAPFGAAVVVATLALLVAHLRAGLQLFGEGLGAGRVERRPVAGVIGLILLGGLLYGGLSPDAYLRPIADFAREFLLTLRPF